jgi:hypothetical protein
MTATAMIRFGGDGQAQVQSYLRLTASTHIQCCIYDDTAPILAIRDGQADITITSPGQEVVTADDVKFGRLLAEAVNRYAAELEDKLAATEHAAEAGPGEPGGQAA